MYVLQWTDAAVDPGKTPIDVPVGSLVSDAATVVLTGKGAANYGAAQQTNVLHMLEHFASPTAPIMPTVGQLWYDSANQKLKVCVATVPITWKQLGVDVSAVAPSPASLGDLWFERTGNASGVLYVFTGKGRYPQSGNTVGGWEQIWPTPMLVGGRPEYAEMLALVNQFIGPDTVGGSGAAGTLITNLTNFAALDASAQALYASVGGNDNNVVYPGTNSAAIKVDANSNDWDTLLAAAKYAVNRLNLPDGVLDNISSMPFISDGRMAPASLIALGSSDYRYPSDDRLAQTKFGSITLHRLYTETFNTLNAAAKYRYTLRGIAGGTGPQTEFWTQANGGTVVHQAFATFAGTMSSVSAADLRIKVKFANAAALTSWLNSGGLIETKLTFSGSATDFQNMVTRVGLTRSNKDSTYIMASVSPFAVSRAVTTNGLEDATATDAQLAWAEESNCSLQTAIRASAANELEFTVALRAPTAVTGQLQIAIAAVYDGAQYGSSPVNAFGRPAAFNALTDVVSKSTYLVAQ